MNPKLPTASQKMDVNNIDRTFTYFIVIHEISM